MHPALSVILFTTASGAGYGLLIWLGFAAALDLVPPERWLGFVALGLATALFSIGLLSSTFHLGRPERAWRAFSQWRTSWLSREGVASVTTFVPTAALAFGWIMLVRLDGVYVVAALAAALCALATVYCTGQIYATLKPIRQWNNIWTTPIYLALALHTGGLLFVLLALVFGAFRSGFAWLGLAVLVLAAAAKIKYWLAIDGEAPRSDLVTATGLTRFQKVRLFEAPHTEANFVMREMGFQVARKHAAKLRRIGVATLFAVPALCLVLIAFGIWATPMALVAVFSAAVGVATERWLFFAEATHASMIYYGQAV